MADRSSPGTSTGITRSLLRVVLDEAGSDGIERVLLQAGLAHRRESLLSADERIPYPEKLRVFDAAARVVGDPRIGLRLGAASMQDEAMEPWRRLAREKGSPEAAFRAVSPFSTRFDSATLLKCWWAVEGSASLSWKVLPPYRPNRVDCDAQMSYLAHVPVVFGFAPATVTHGYACQVAGAAECRYEVTWTATPLRRVSTLLRKPDIALEAADRSATIHNRLRALEGATADLAAMESLEEILDKILDRTDSAVHAPGHLLVVQTPNQERHVRSRGLGEVLEASLDDAGINLNLESPDLGGLPIISVPVQSSKRSYGFLAAVAHRGQEFFPDDADALTSYAQHVAVSLDIAGIVAEAREHAETAGLLLEVSNSLSEHSSVGSLSASLASSVAALTGADRSAIALWDEGAGRVRVAGMSGWHGELADQLAAYVVNPKESPELAHMLVERSPLLLDARSSEWAQRMLKDFRISALVAVPIMSGDRFAGIVLAHWVGPGPATLDGALTARLNGVASLASVAIDRMGLIEDARRQALHDPLTGLPNRALLQDRLENALATTARNGRRVGIVFCNIDRFKRINEGLGHDAGDTALRHLAARLSESVPEASTVARYSGDNFVILLPEIGSVSEVQGVGERIRQSLEAPLEIAGNQIVLDVVIGSAVGSVRSGDRSMAYAESGCILIAEAELEMSRAKASAKGKTAPRGQHSTDLRLESDLRGAASRGELRVQFQPQIDVRTKSVIAAEALVRWQHPELGLLAPAAFIPLAEDSNLIAEVGAHVLLLACRAGATWHAAGHQLEIAVNVSSAQLSDPTFPTVVQETLTRSGFPAESLTLEVTESQAMSDSAVNDGNLRELRNLGIGISIDDFGTGYSSLAQLHRMPVTEVKIDRSFTARIGDDGSDAFINGIIGLAHGLGLLVIAEGVETSEQLGVLARIGCDRAQGYLLGKPMDADELGQLFTSPQPVASTTDMPDVSKKSIHWTLQDAGDDLRAAVRLAVENAGFRVEPAENTEVRIHVPRSIRHRRRAAWLTARISSVGSRTVIEWTNDDDDERTNLEEILLEIEKTLPDGVLYDHGFASAAQSVGLIGAEGQTVRRISNLLDHSDVIHAVGSGEMDGYSGLAVLTESRLLFVPTHGTPSAKLTDVDLDTIDAIHLGKRSSGETLKVEMAGVTSEISKMGHGEGHGLSKAFRRLTAKRDPAEDRSKF